MKLIGVIPARYASSRFPGKPLVRIAGKLLLERVVNQCRLARSLTDVVVATDDERIRAAAAEFCRVEMTSPDHPSGTDRVAEAAARVDCDGVVNIQGDEPLIDPSVIDAVGEALQSHAMSTAATAIRDPAEYDNPNVVKVVCDGRGRALYFSRRTIPYLRDRAGTDAAASLKTFPFLKHLGIYGFRRKTLAEFVRYPVAALEAAERLEQLRALENGISIAVARVDYDSIGVDVPSDVERVERFMQISR